MLEQVVYMSATSPNVGEDCLRDVLRESTANNPSSHVTGMLLYINGSFLQVLEGEAQTIAALYEKISRDPRHKSVAKISQCSIEEREFGKWSMGWARIGAADLDRIVDKNDFFQSGHCLTELSDTLVKRILRQFREGQWRRRIE